jgi:hypothetical protein
MAFSRSENKRVLSTEAGKPRPSARSGPTHDRHTAFSDDRQRMQRSKKRQPGSPRLAVGRRDLATPKELDVDRRILGRCRAVLNQVATNTSILHTDLDG